MRPNLKPFIEEVYKINWHEKDGVISINNDPANLTLQFGSNSVYGIVRDSFIVNVQLFKKPYGEILRMFNIAGEKPKILRLEFVNRYILEAFSNIKYTFHVENNLFNLGSH